MDKAPWLLWEVNWTLTLSCWDFSNAFPALLVWTTESWAPSEPSFSLLPWALECSLCSSYTLTQNSDSRSLALQRNTELLENCCLTVVIIIEDDSPIHWHLYYLLHLYPYEGRDLKGNILDRSSLGSAMVFVSFLPSNPGPCVDSAHTSALNCTPPAQQVREYFYS